MTEALTAIIQFGFEHIHLHRIEAQVAYPNLASTRLLEKLGFQEEGRLRDSQYANNQSLTKNIGSHQYQQRGWIKSPLIAWTSSQKYEPYCW